MAAVSVTYRNEINLLMEQLKRSLELPGIWPSNNNSSAWYKIKKMFSFCNLCIFGVLMSMQLNTDSGIARKQDLGYITFEVTAICVTLNAVTKSVALNQKRFARILDLLKHPVFISHSDELHRKIVRKMQICRPMVFINFLVGMTAATFFIINPLVVINSLGRTLFIPTLLDMNETSYYYYVPVMCFQFIGVILLGWVTPAVNSVSLAFIFTATAQLEVLREKLKNYTNNECFRKAPSESNVSKNLIMCVEHHMVIERFIAAIEETFNIAYLFQVLMSCVMCCLLGFNSILVPVASMEFARCVAFLVAMMIELSFLCIPGNEIILQSLNIRDACYASPWINHNKEVRKALFIIMERSKRPFGLTAGKFVDISLPTCVTIMRSAFSYFTVLKQFYSDEL